MNFSKILYDSYQKLNQVYAHNEQLRSYQQTFQQQINELQQQIDKCNILLFENHLKEVELKKFIKEL